MEARPAADAAAARAVLPRMRSARPTGPRDGCGPHRRPQGRLAKVLRSEQSREPMPQLPQPQNSARNAQKSRAIKAPLSGVEAVGLGARARCGSDARGFPAAPSPRSKSLPAPLENRWPPSVRDFFPTGNFRKAPACSPLFDRGGHEFPPTPRPSNCEGRGMRRSAAGGGEND